MWIVMAVADGDGVSDYGHRVTSHRFNTHQAAHDAADFLKRRNIETIVLRDKEETK